jgi:hypothetical protein
MIDLGGHVCGFKVLFMVGDFMSDLGVVCGPRYIISRCCLWPFPTVGDFNAAK